MNDNVNHPEHYAGDGIECIDAIKASMSKYGYLGYLKGNCMKYLWRFEKKGGLEDLLKCEFYLKEMIKAIHS